MKLQIQTREVFGRTLFYPMCQPSRWLCKLGKRRPKAKVWTFSASDMRLLKKLGFEFEFVPYQPKTQQFGKTE